MAEDLSVQMDKILNEYVKDVQDVTNESIDSVSKDSVQKLKNSSPKRTGAYARSWTRKKERGVGGVDTIIVHNSKHYQLTHLLENGHVIRNKKGTYGRTNGDHHISNVEQWANQELPNEIERKL